MDDLEQNRLSWNAGLMSRSKWAQPVDDATIEGARRRGLEVACIRGDMAGLRALRGGSFDLIFHAVSNVFVPDLVPVWRGCFPVLRAGGALLAGFMNPAIFLFDPDQEGQPGALTARFALPCSDLQFGGQIDAGFVIAGFYEDRWYDDSWPLANLTPVSVATRAIRVA